VRAGRAGAVEEAPHTGVEDDGPLFMEDAA
jgi:hypothetical protein